MKGLLIKDAKILLVQKKLLIIYVFVSIMLSFTMDSSFIACYFPMIGVMLILSTIAYDHHDNGMSFLMTLPVKPASYAVAKYVFSFLGLIISFVIAVILQFASLVIQVRNFSVGETIAQDFLMLPMFFLMIAIMIPIDLKFTPEKGRIMLFVIFGIIMVIVIAGKAIFEKIAAVTGFDMEIFIDKLKNSSPVMLFFAVYAIVVLIVSVSMIISVRIMQKKEF